VRRKQDVVVSATELVRDGLHLSEMSVLVPNCVGPKIFRDFRVEQVGTR